MGWLVVQKERRHCCSRKNRSESNCWNIGKSQLLALETTQKRRSTPLVFNASRLVRSDQVSFWQPECDCVDTERCRDDRCCGSVVMGSVKLTDPFINQGLVTDVEGNDVFVSYRQLRNKPCCGETKPDNKIMEMEIQSLNQPAHQFGNKLVWLSPLSPSHKWTSYPYSQMLMMTLTWLTFHVLMI